MKTLATNLTETVLPLDAEGFSSPLVETWHQDSEDADLWHGPHGVIVNSAALEMRKAFYTIQLERA